MKKLIILLFIGFISTPVFAQQETKTFAKASWDKTTQNFGKIAYDQPVTACFTVTNIGSIPLQILGVQYVCNCTVPEWPAKGILPGSTGTIKVIYDAKIIGMFNKVVKVTMNTETGIEELTLTGTVIEKATSK